MIFGNYYFPCCSGSEILFIFQLDIKTGTKNYPEDLEDTNPGADSADDG